MNRVAVAVPAAALVFIAALLPIEAVATTSPSPKPSSSIKPTPTLSPTLDRVLVAPPAGFVQVTSSAIHGRFTADQYAGSIDKTKAASITNTLNQDGFVDGYGKAWIQQSVGHGLAEVAIAFAGGRGARRWLASAETSDKADPTWKHADSITGIDTYYGGHFVNPATGTTGDIFSFVKGNDVFIVGAVSISDDVLNLATAQTKAQYSGAPASTIPASRWPENAPSHVVSSSGGGIAGKLAIVIFVLAVIAAALFFGLRWRRRPAPVATPTAVPAEGLTVGPAPGTPAPPDFAMSPDANFWWDGQAWRDASTDIPPSAQRSGDGTQWWDGRTWRPVRQPPWGG